MTILKFWIWHYTSRWSAITTFIHILEHKFVEWICAIWRVSDFHINMHNWENILHRTPYITWLHSTFHNYAVLCDLLCPSYKSLFGEFVWIIYPYASGLLHWHLLGQSYCPSASEVTLKDMDQINLYQKHQNTTKHKQRIHSRGMHCRCLIVATLVYNISRWSAGSTVIHIEHMIGAMDYVMSQMSIQLCIKGQISCTGHLITRLYSITT